MLARDVYAKINYYSQVSYSLSDTLVGTTNVKIANKW